MRPVNGMKALAASHGDVHVACANFQSVQRNAGKIHRRDMLSAPCKKHSISSRPASDVQRGTRWQKRQEFADDTRRLRGRRIGREPVLGIPIGLARGHKKGS